MEAFLALLILVALVSSLPVLLRWLGKAILFLFDWVAWMLVIFGVLVFFQGEPGPGAMCLLIGICWLSNSSSDNQKT